MKRMWITLRISLGLVSLTAISLLTAQLFGLFPDKRQTLVESRKALSEAIAINCSLAASKNDWKSMDAAVRGIADRNPDIIAAVVRRANGRIATEVRKTSESFSTAQNAAWHIEAPIFMGKNKWGALELDFRALEKRGSFAWLSNPFARLMFFVLAMSLLGFTFYLLRVFSYLDPKTVIPHHVRHAFDSLSEGLVILDKQERIVLANNSFSRIVGRTLDQLHGQKVSGIGWVDNEASKPVDKYPWLTAIQEGVMQKGAVLCYHDPEKGLRKLVVNSTPILDANNNSRGAMTTFDDVTEVEEKNFQLTSTLKELDQYKQEIEQQNQELHCLASRDPLTSCLNRRSFFAHFETLWNSCQQTNRRLACVMLDIDHFKKINDMHGHATGDQVLQQIAGVLISLSRERDIVCRYGGEEFCVLLPDCSIEDASVVAEKFRQGIEMQQPIGLIVTTSLGVSALDCGAKEPSELLEQADKALYIAKHRGRNQVVKWNAVSPSELVTTEEESPEKIPAAETDSMEMPVQFLEVTAFVSALARRDVELVEHSYRVADLCVAIAQGMMPQKACYILEVAALLHDLGKLTLPEFILKKTTPLTSEEWQIVREQELAGARIVEAAFGSAELSQIIRTYRAWYQGNPKDPSLPKGEDIPISARILSIAEAFTAMTSPRPYRATMTREEAVAELHRCSPAQFDPELVERFDKISAACENHSASVLRISSYSNSQSEMPMGDFAAV